MNLLGLVPRMDSSIITADVFVEVHFKLSSLSLASILVNLAWNRLPEAQQAESSIVNLRLLLSDILNPRPTPTSATSCSSTLNWFAFLLQDPYHFARLELLYLPTLSCLSPKYQTDEIITSIGNVALAAKNRNVLVVFEEQSDQMKGESQVSEDFMRRMTQRRIGREVEAG
ncbi:uncharacterized protein JCM6883_007336 [Sporobolomyces salmoneus]|uniref:uncharacterized protein n=1 Tax=Sporobolomyces salmoneus TaxID=183962 RepID=UPI00317F7614